MSDSKPCPNCGHCPTCGHSPKPAPYPVYPYPYYYPWGTGNPWWQQPVTITWTSSSTAKPTAGMLASSN